MRIRLDSWLDHCPFARPDLVALWSQSQITALKSHVLTMQAAIVVLRTSVFQAGRIGQTSEGHISGREYACTLGAISCIRVQCNKGWRLRFALWKGCRIEVGRCYRNANQMLIRGSLIRLEKFGCGPPIPGTHLSRVVYISRAVLGPCRDRGCDGICLLAELECHSECQPDAEQRRKRASRGLRINADPQRRRSAMGSQAGGHQHLRGHRALRTCSAANSCGLPLRVSASSWPPN